MCAVLAIIGASLGGYALYRRSAAAPPPAAEVAPPPEPARLGSVDGPRKAEQSDDAAETSLGDASP
jgi:hypothetical protein